MDFQTAARVQYLRTSIYTVWLVSPAGERTQIGTSQRKAGTALLSVLTRPENLDAFRAKAGDISAVTFKKKAGRVELSNGWRVEFGGTIRQEASK